MSVSLRVFDRKSISVVLERIIEVGILAVVVLSPLPFGSVQPWSILTFELTLFFLAICWFIQIYIDGSSFVRITPLGWALAGLVILFFFQTVFLPRALIQILSPQGSEIYQEATRSFQKVHPLSLYSYITMGELYKLAAYLIFYLLVVNRRNSKFFQRALIAVIGITFFETFYGLFEFLSGRFKIFWYLNAVSIGNTSGTFINKNHYAIFLEMGILVWISFFIEKISKKIQYSKGIKALILDFFSEKNIICLLFIFLSAGTVAAIIFSGSRAGVVLSLTGIMLYLFFVLFFYGNWIRKCFLGIFIGVSIASTIWILAGDLRQVVGNIKSGAHQRDLRYDIFQDSLNITKDFFVFGCGLGAYQYVFPLYQFKTKPAEAGTYVDHAHNDYLELVCESGFVGGIILLVGGLLTFLRAFYRIDLLKLGVLVGLVCVTLHNFLDFSFHIPSIALMYLFLMGFISVYEKKMLDSYAS